MVPKIKTAQKGVAHLSQYLPIKTLDQMYKILIRPHFTITRGVITKIMFHFMPMKGAQSYT